MFGIIIWRVSHSWLSSIWEPTAVAGKAQAAGYQLHDLGFDAKSLKVENYPNPIKCHAVSPIADSKHVKKHLCLQDTKADQGGDEALLRALLTGQSCDVLP